MAKITVTKLMAMDDTQIAKLTEPELKSAIRSMQKSISQRIKRLHKAGIFNSPAESYINRVGTPKTAGEGGARLNVGQLQNQLKKGINFFEGKSSTISGYREVHEFWVREYGETYADLTTKQQNAMWEAYKKYSEVYPEDFTHGKDASLRILNVFLSVVGADMTTDQILARVEQIEGHEHDAFDELVDSGEANPFDVDTAGKGVNRFF